MEHPETSSETVAPPKAPGRRHGFRSGGGDGHVRRGPWALILLLMASMLAVILAAYAWAAREERSRV